MWIQYNLIQNFERRGMKLSLMFALIDVLIVVAYPFVFLVEKLRQLFKIKR